MDRRSAQGAATLAILDPDGSFVDRLRDDRDALTGLAYGLWSMPKETRLLRLAKIEELAHRLAGAAGTFGYERVGIAALELESCAAAESNGQDCNEDRSALEVGLAGLRVALESSLDN